MSVLLRNWDTDSFTFPPFVIIRSFASLRMTHNLLRMTHNLLRMTHNLLMMTHNLLRMTRPCHSESVSSKNLYKRCPLNSSALFADKYAGAISNTVLQPLLPSFESLYAALA